MRYNSCHAIKLVLLRRPPRTSLELRKSTPLESHRFSTVCVIKSCKKFAERTPSVRSGCGAAGSALPWGGRGRKFKSCHSDQLNEQRKLLVFLCFIKLLGHFEATFKMPCFYALLRSFLRCVTQFVTQKCVTHLFLLKQYKFIINCP